MSKFRFSGGFSHGRKALLRGGVSLVALVGVGAAMGAAAPAFGQDKDAAVVDEVVVIGVRKSLETSQQIKKNADTIVDSITATDIGAFPDKSVAEALQRVPGVTVSRLQSSDDSSHFSAEPAGVLIRGLTQVRTEFNGRDSFSADAARGLNFNDISPELMAGVDSYKNQTAEMIEGGIAGTVNLRTRLPFDSKNQVITLSGKANYGNRSKDVTYEYSGIISKTWDVDFGRIGLMADYAYSHVLTQTEGVVMQRIGTFCSAGNNDVNGKAIVSADGSIPCTTNPYGGSGWRYMPDQVNYSQVEYDRVRKGTALAFQYENNDGTVRFKAQYNDSKYKNAWLERSTNVVMFGLWAAPAYSPQTTAFIAPAQGSPAFTFGPDGMLTSGILTQPTGDWGSSTQDNINRGSAVPGQPFVNYCGGIPACATQRQGLYIENQARNFDHSEGTSDISANLQWDVSDRLHTSFDVQYIDADTNNYDILVANRTMADAQYRVNGDGTPQITLQPGSNVNYAPGFLSNPHNYWIPFIQDHYEDNDATELALRADGEYEFAPGGWLNSLKVGVRYADRKQKVRYSTYNWSPVAAPWNCNGPGFNIDNTTPQPYPAACGHAGNFQGYGAGIWSVAGLDNFYNGEVFPNNELVFLSKATLADHDGLIKALSGATTNSPMAWTPLCQRTTNTEGCFIPPELVDVEEETMAAYGMLRFGGEDMTIFNGVTVQGNVGLRFVETKTTSTGGVAYPTSTWYTSAATTPCSAPLGPNSVTNISCWLTPQLLAFSNGGSSPNDFSGKHDNWLPSLNVRFGLSDKSFVRFAASRAMSRPDFGLLRNFVAVQTPALNTSPDSPYVTYNSPTAPHIPANVTGYNFQFNADSGFGALKPITADQFDLTFEHYFTESSSFSFDVFYKKLNGSIAYGEFLRSFTNNGVTQNVLVRGPRNGNGGGELKGFEVAYQTFFDFLPSPWDGLGVQANYTHTKQEGINNSNLATQPGYAAGGTVAFGGGLQVNGAVMDSHRLAGISDDSYNLVGLYEKGPIAMRLAYSWRSDFLTNNLDCCIGLPIYQKDAGFLDGSIRYQVNDNIEVSLDASNILDTTTVFQQQVFGDSALTPGAKPVKIDSSWIRNDRRFQLGIRFKY
ncbi:TonB-dependent receptor [Caulobacter sp. Root487D2Y]|uniref:TonB-dependent receptor n=1 Tax=Caulobacter sp. Root487D2Y TaxID=1736547 RepID=UPI0006F9062C|nr:TonB-dependent receptor [Caulobacter sp. Root487D2Y]KQY35930.1 TonB-dependent receptor [Caulobacter sp. Root487D2Y]